MTYFLANALRLITPWVVEMTHGSYTVGFAVVVVVGGTVVVVVVGATVVVVVVGACVVLIGAAVVVVVVGTVGASVDGKAVVVVADTLATIWYVAEYVYGLVWITATYILPTTAELITTRVVPDQLSFLKL